MLTVQLAVLLPRKLHVRSVYVDAIDFRVYLLLISVVILLLDDDRYFFYYLARVLYHKGTSTVHYQIIVLYLVLWLARRYYVIDYVLDL